MGAALDTIDRIPPQNIEAEQAVLGALLLNPDSIGIAIEILGSHGQNAFYVEAHRLIFGAAVELATEGTPIDEVTLYGRLKANGHLEESGGYSYFGELTSAVPTSANLPYYASLIRDAWLLRRLILSSTTIVASAFDEAAQAPQLLQLAEAEILKIAETQEAMPVSEVADIVDGVVEQMENLIDNRGATLGVSTGFPDLDHILCGLQAGDMIVLAARPSVGKTALALNITRHLAVDEGKPVLFFSLEMTKDQLVQRLIGMVARINGRKLQEGFLPDNTKEQIRAAADRIRQAPISIDDSATLSILEVRAKANRMMAHKDLALVVVDYLQLMEAPQALKRRENRQSQITEISRGIKQLAREIQVPVLALSQLSREAEKDDRGIPRLSHLRESGSIEQDADVVLMLYRPKKKEGGDQIFVNVAKQRNGPIGEMELIFMRDFQRFESRERRQEEPPQRQGEFDGEDEDEDEEGVPF